VHPVRVEACSDLLEKNYNKVKLYLVALWGSASKSVGTEIKDSKR